MKKLKDREFILARIKIKKYREHYKDGPCHSFKDKLLVVEIHKGYSKVTSCFQDNIKGNKKLLDFIAREIYLKVKK